MHRLLITAAVLTAAASAAYGQVELKNYADAKGYIDVQKPTCDNWPAHFRKTPTFSGSGTAVGTMALHRSMRSTFRGPRRAFIT
jgi:hypothetical protein